MYTELELNKLIETVEKEFSAHLAKAEAGEVSLSKSEDSGETAISKVEETAQEPVLKAEEKAEHEAKPEHEEHKEEHKEAEHKEHEEHEHGYDEEDMEHMHKMYCSMSKAELKAHHASVCSALEKCGEMQMEKTEQKTETVVVPEVKVEAKIEETNLMKSENEALKAEIAELKKNWEGVSGFLTKLVEKTSAPAAKAITSVDVIAKSEGSEEKKELSKAEITAKLYKKACDPTLAKSDRDLINNFYANSATVDSISHLLK